jgi:hypothetical protein
MRMESTPPNDAQLARIRETIKSTIEEWRRSYRVRPSRTHYSLVCLLVAAMLAMHETGTITINREAEGPEGGM